MSDRRDRLRLFSGLVADGPNILDADHPERIAINVRKPRGSDISIEDRDWLISLICIAPTMLRVMADMAIAGNDQARRFLEREYVNHERSPNYRSPERNRPAGQ